MKRKKLIPLSRLRKKAWTLFSIWVRTSRADFSGYTRCYTCDRILHWKEAQAGHFIHGSYDFDPFNVHAQCASCNKWGHGKPLEYYIHLVKDYGTVKADELRSRAHWNNYNRKDLEVIVKKYDPTNTKTYPRMVRDVRKAGDRKDQD